MSETRSADAEVFDFADRVFHLEILKGGMNRLLFRSNRSSQFPTRVEILFMNVQYLSVGTLLDGMTVRDIGAAEARSDVGWRIDWLANLRVYEIGSSSGSGRIIAASATVDQSDAGPSDPSHFFMMD